MVKLPEELRNEARNEVLSIDGLLSDCLSIKDIINKTITLFKDANIESPRVDTELLLANAANCSTIDLYIDQGSALGEYARIYFAGLVRKRLNRMPIQYILGHTEFMSLDFLVNRDVLIPRPETELIVESVLDIANNKLNSNNLDMTPDGQHVKVIDMCTGSGNIGISIAVMLKNAQVYASDISIDALDIAMANANRHKVEDRIEFFQGDIFDAFKAVDVDLKADFIVSNPPYVAKRELDSLQPEVIRYEPCHALAGGNDGFDFFRKIISDANDWAKDDGYLILEIGEGQLEGILKIINIYQNEIDGNRNGFRFLDSVKDLQGIDRIVIAQKQV